MAARIPTINTTISTSTRVKPSWESAARELTRGTPDQLARHVLNWRE